MRSAAWCRTLATERSGNVSILLATALSSLMAVSALAVDAGTLFLEKRRLQGIADAAALAAAGDIPNRRANAQAAIDANGGNPASITELVVGSYVPDVAAPLDTRFVAGNASGNAVRVGLRSAVPTFFARAFSQANAVPVSVQATAARIDLAAFSIGSRLAAVQGGLPNAILSGIAGTELGLSVMDYQALASSRVDVLAFAEQLRTTANLDVATFGELLAADITLPQAVRALAGAASGQTARAALLSMAARLPERPVRLADLIDLGPLASSVRADGDKRIDVDAFSFARAMLELASASRQVDSSVELGIPGIASSRLHLEIGERPGHSPWLAVSAANKVTVRTAQARLYLEAVLLGGPLSAVAQVRVPIFIELAQAEARLSDVSCAGGRANSTLTLSVTPALGQVAIADLDRAKLPDFTTAMTLTPALLAKTPLVSVTGRSDIHLGGVTPQTVGFSAADIERHTVKTVSTNDLVQGVAASLLSRVTLETSGLLPLFGISPVTAAVGGILSQAGAPLDALIAQVTALAGVSVGQADVAAHGLRCGTPMLVA